MTEESPFKPGARVAVRDKWGDGETEAFVDKVHKTGRFTLKGSNQQWKPWTSRPWNAIETGGSGVWRKRTLRIWDAAADAEIGAARALAARIKRRENLVSALERLDKSALTDAMLDQIEAALTVPAKEAAE